MSIVFLVVRGYVKFCITSENIFSYLLIISLEILHKIFQDVSLICFKMQFEEHMMGDDHSKRNPIQRALFDSGLKKVRMIANLFQTHQDIHHAC